MKRFNFSENCRFLTNFCTLFIQSIFSVTNSENKKYKIIKILGLRIKIKQKNCDAIDVDNYPIQLSQNEQEFLLKHVQNANSYLEFGSGGSTFTVLLKTNISSVVSVESDKNWIEYMRKWNIIPDSECDNRLKFLYVNIGKTGDWGIPIDIENNIDLFPNYSKEPFGFNNKFDVIFIDGRFRVACALQSILNSDLNTRILIHDFNNRQSYHCILEFLQIEDTMDSMAIFRIKDNYNREKLFTLYDEYKVIYE